MENGEAKTYETRATLRIVEKIGILGGSDLIRAQADRVERLSKELKAAKAGLEQLQTEHEQAWLECCKAHDLDPGKQPGDYEWTKGGLLIALRSPPPTAD